MKAWDVYKHTQEEVYYGPSDPIDTVFYDDDCDAEYVRRGLIEHDGYDPSISVRCEETGEHSPADADD